MKSSQVTGRRSARSQHTQVQALNPCEGEVPGINVGNIKRIMSHYAQLPLQDIIIIVHHFNHTSRVTAVTPTDRPKSVRSRCVIEVFGGVFVLLRCFLDLSVCDFCHRTELDLFLFSLYRLPSNIQSFHPRLAEGFIWFLYPCIP